MRFQLAADFVVAIHLAYVAVVVLGFVAILIGAAAHWRWVRRPYFRLTHLAMILLVCLEAALGAACPLTTLESRLRLKAGATAYSRDFIGYWLDRLIFYNAPPWTVTAIYFAFGTLVMLTFWLVPIHFRHSD
jgi:Protein of Unknown function (DUF2784)